MTLGSRDQEFAQKRQLFLTEQGYHYNVIDLESPTALEHHLAGEPVDPEPRIVS